MRLAFANAGSIQNIVNKVKDLRLLGVKIQYLATNLSDRETEMISEGVECNKSCLRFERIKGSEVWDLWLYQDPTWQHDLLAQELCASFTLAMAAIGNLHSTYLLQTSVNNNELIVSVI